MIILLLLSLFSTACSGAMVDEDALFKRNVFRLDVNGWKGTGFAVYVKNSLVMLTNYHVCSVSPDNKVKVTSYSHENQPGLIKEMRPDLDLCLIETKLSQGLELEPEGLAFGMDLASAGYPGMTQETLVKTTGHVVFNAMIPLNVPVFMGCPLRSRFMGHHPERPFVLMCEAMFPETMSTMTINPGQSGSPVINRMNGKVVGIVNARIDGYGSFIELRSSL